MKPLSLAESVRLPEERAVQRYFDDSNWRVLRWILAGFFPGALVGSIISLVEGNYLTATAWGLDLAAVVGFAVMRRSSFLEVNFRKLLIGYLALQLAVLAYVSPDMGFTYGLGGYIFPFTLIFFRLRSRELLGLLALSLGLAIWAITQMSQLWGEILGGSIGGVTGVLVCFALSRRWTNGARRRFLAGWRVEHSRAQEQARMRGELDDARKIQLSMLPNATPNLAWLDLASASLPATEVGGDYFDYVSLDQERLAIVVGDVAGHGMASGLVLAAIRGGLHLLSDDLPTPQTALLRLDRMVQEIAPGRMYVTLQISLLDHSAGEMTVVSAGHPPAFHFRAGDGTVHELGTPATPLGTRLESRLQEDRSTFGPGDVLLFYSDGLPEAMNARGEQFGSQRVIDALRRAATGHSAAEIRSAMINAVNRFKGDIELEDDLTLVVAKIAG